MVTKVTRQDGREWGSRCICVSSPGAFFKNIFFFFLLIYIFYQQIHYLGLHKHTKMSLRDYVNTNRHPPPIPTPMDDTDTSNERCGTVATSPLVTNTWTLDRR